jgi:hypothetical protein
MEGSHVVDPDDKFLSLSRGGNGNECSGDNSLNGLHILKKNVLKYYSFLSQRS